jgi:hypothetical protein
MKGCRRFIEMVPELAAKATRRNALPALLGSALAITSMAKSQPSSDAKSKKRKEKQIRRAGKYAKARCVRTTSVSACPGFTKCCRKFLGRKWKLGRMRFCLCVAETGCARCIGDDVYWDF